MASKQLSRKEFLRLLWVSAVGTAASACQNRLSTLEPTLEPSRIPTMKVNPTATMEKPTSIPTPTTPGVIQLAGDNADVWAWSSQVRGKVTGPLSCDQVQVDINGQRIEAQSSAAEFTAQLPIQEGENQITAICLESAGQVRSQTLVYTGRLQNRPVAQIQVSLENSFLVLDSKESHPEQATGPAIQEYLWSARPGNPAPVQVVDSSGVPGQDLGENLPAKVLRLALPATDGEYYFTLQVKDEAGQTDSSGIYVVVENSALRIPDYDRENPAFVENTIVYGVIPRKFGSPGFQSLIAHLDDLQDLGVNALWLAPVNVSPDYGYAVKDYFNLNPSYGSKDDFHQLVQAAHARGIRILMDFVPNHSSDQHPYYQNLQALGKDSPYWEFYDHDASGEVTHYFDWTNLPNHNFSNPDVRRYITEAFSYWVREFDVDGFRVDVAWGIKERCPEYWPAWRRELKRIKPDLLLLAEAGARDPYYFDNGFDVAYDWTGELGHWAWENVWGSSYKDNLLIYNLDTALTNRPNGFHPDALIFRFLNNNDTGMRFVTRHGVEMTRVATAMLLTLPGLPCVYTGDELGAEFSPYYDSHPLEWTEKVPGLRDYHKKLINLRKELPSLHSRHWQIVDAEPHSRVYTYLRHLQDGSQPVLVALNFFPEDAQVELQLPEQFQSLAKGNTLKDLLAEETIPIQAGGSLKFNLPGMRAMILTKA